MPRETGNVKKPKIVTFGTSKIFSLDRLTKSRVSKNNRQVTLMLTHLISGSMERDIVSRITLI